MSNKPALAQGVSLVQRVADKFGVDSDKLLPALKQTAFRQQGGKEITNEQMMALLIVANEYGLNPFTKEIFAFPDKGGIVPVVSVDGWSRIINENPQMDGIEFEYSPETVQFKGKTCHEWIDCIIYRKDRSKPIRVREFFCEVARDLNYASPWDTHPNRMHRHKAEIQCARIAFGFAGIYDMDEAERILEASKVAPTSPSLESATDEQKAYFDQMITQSDDVGMFLFTKSIDEAVFTSLYHSFEKGTKGKYQGIVDSLCQKGAARLRDVSDALADCCERGDDAGALELLEGLSVDATEYMATHFLDHEPASYMRQILSEQAA